MSLEIIRQRISSISGDIRRLSDVLHEMDELDDRHSPKRYEELSVEAARRSEWITLRLRHLIYRDLCIRKKDYLSQAVDSLGIKIEWWEGVYEIHPAWANAEAEGQTGRGVPFRSAYDCAGAVREE